MRAKGFLIFGLLVLGLIALASAARQLLSPAALNSRDDFVFDQSFTLNSSRDSGLVVLAEAIQFGENSDVAGNVALIASEVHLAGHIDGDLTVLAEHVELDADSQITGNVTLLVNNAEVGAANIGGTLDLRGDQIALDPALRVGGAIYGCVDRLFASELPVLPCDESDLMTSTQTLESLSDPQVILPLLNLTISGVAVYAIFSAFASLALSGLSILAVVIFPRQISYIEEAIRRNPRGVGGTGLAILLLAAGVSVGLGLLLVALPPLGFVIVPAYLLVVLLFAGMVLAGWITVTLMAGDLFLQRLGRPNLPPLVIAAVGNVTLLLAWNVLAINSLSRFLGFMLLLVLGAVGLGATFSTRLGTRPAYRSYLVQG